MKNQPLLQTNIPGYPVRRGKVRDIYDLGDALLMISTDRISAVVSGPSAASAPTISTSAST